MQITLGEALQKGIEAHLSGNIQEADRYYTAILKANPKHPDANHNMGILAIEIGKADQAIPFLEDALEANPRVEQFWLSLITALLKLERLNEAKKVFSQGSKQCLAENNFDKLRDNNYLRGTKLKPTTTTQEPSNSQLNAAINFYNDRQYKAALTKADELIKRFPYSATLQNICGAANKAQGSLGAAIKNFEKAISFNPDYVEAYGNLGTALYDYGNLDKAIDAYKKALKLNPNYFKALYNMGNALQQQDKLKEAVEAYRKAISIKPDYYEAYGNLGAALQDQGKLDKAIKAYKKAIEIEPEYSKAFHNLSTIDKYKFNPADLSLMQNLYKKNTVSDEARSDICFILAKNFHNLGETKQAFEYLKEGNALRKRCLNYKIKDDEMLFDTLKRVQPKIQNSSLSFVNNNYDIIPIFIVGMPRSGTSLVEQIISSHSSVTGAGELNFINRFGRPLALGLIEPNKFNMQKFRDMYLENLSMKSKGKNFVTDKMPQNFRYLALICAAFPEAKIISVERNAPATCWSNYMQNFSTDDLGFCYNLQDTVSYYKLYADLMSFWQISYGLRVYSLDYEELVQNQKVTIKNLIRHLELKWDNKCLSPQDNDRIVRTASAEQVKRKVYRGSSEAWQQYEPYLKGAFDNLTLKVIPGSNKKN